MGKGYNNYMTKKPFHPGSKANIKRTWMAEQRTENEKRKQEELKAQYDKEQDLYNNRALLSTESKEKLQLNFMYEAPPGAKRERQKEDDEPEYKFEWQRKYNAPREDYAKGNEEIRDQPFGIAVRNVRCIKCHKWGHLNTDKECPMYTYASSASMPKSTMDPMELMQQMREDGFGLKKSALGHQIDPKRANEQFVQSDEDSDPEMEFLKSLSSKQKKKLLKRLNKLSKKQKKKENRKAKEVDKKIRKKEKGKHKKKRSDSDSESDVEEKKVRKKTKVEENSENSSESSDSNMEEKPLRKEKKAKPQKIKEELHHSPSSLKHEKAAKHSKNAKSNVLPEKSSEKSPVKIKTENPLLSSSEIRKKSSSDDKTEESKESKNTNTCKESEDKSRTTENEQNKSFAKSDETNPPVQQYLKKGKSKVVKSGNSSDSSDSSDEEKSDKHENKKRRSRDSKKRSSTPDMDFPKPSKKLATPTKLSTEIDADPCSSSDIPDKHPDGFDPEFPQRNVSLSHSEIEQDISLHDRFRARHRNRRSPSVKQKYRND